MIGSQLNSFDVWDFELLASRDWDFAIADFQKTNKAFKLLLDEGAYVAHYFLGFKRVQGLGPSATCIARYALEAAFFFCFVLAFFGFKRVQGLGPSATCIARYALEVTFFFELLQAEHV